jgi:hypothetical protein
MMHKAHQFKIPGQNQLDRVDGFLDGQLEDLKDDIIQQFEGTPSHEQQEAMLLAEIAGRSAALQSRSEYAKAA